MALLWPFADPQRVANFESPDPHVPRELTNGDPLPSFSFHNVNKYPFLNISNATFFTFLCFWLVIFLFGTVPKGRVNVLPKCKEAAMCLMEKIPMLDRLCSVMSCSAVGCEFNVNESTA